MKKIIAILLVLMSLCSVVSADDTKTTVVNYTPTQGYVWNISANNITLTSSGVNMSVSAQEVRIASGKKLSISVASANGWKLMYSTDEISYTLAKGATTVTNNTEVLSVAAGSYSTTPTSQQLDFTLGSTSSVLYSEAYTDTLTFTAEIVNA
ncbi:MAG: hypothetical protein IJI66_08765 [Erysipelotrichaceae bacterium]|nr:hypothetical protein [Erysipelotrichaceae bacterium]